MFKKKPDVVTSWTSDLFFQTNENETANKERESEKEKNEKRKRTVKPTRYQATDQFIFLISSTRFKLTWEIQRKKKRGKSPKILTSSNVKNWSEGKRSVF